MDILPTECREQSVYVITPDSFHLLVSVSGDRYKFCKIGTEFLCLIWTKFLLQVVMLIPPFPYPGENYASSLMDTIRNNSKRTINLKGGELFCMAFRAVFRVADGTGWEFVVQFLTGGILEVWACCGHCIQCTQTEAMVVVGWAVGGVVKNMARGRRYRGKKDMGTRCFSF
jgi:hypothetical protein